MNFIRKLPKKVGLALSGGVDSMVLLHVLLSKRHEVTIYHYQHDSTWAPVEYDFCSAIAERHGLQFITEKQDPGVEQYSSSREMNWRVHRQNFLRKFCLRESLICTGHNLDDAAEWYIKTAACGAGFFMDYSSQTNLVKPMILIQKSEILEYAKNRGIEWLEDPTNADVDFAQRNKIRHEILPKFLEINPGFYTTIKNRIVDRTNMKHG